MNRASIWICVKGIFQGRNLSDGHFYSFYLFGFTFSVKNYTLVSGFSLLNKHREPNPQVVEVEGSVLISSERGMWSKSGDIWMVLLVIFLYINILEVSLKSSFRKKQENDFPLYKLIIFLKENIACHSENWKIEFIL